MKKLFFSVVAGLMSTVLIVCCFGFLSNKGVAGAEFEDELLSVDEAEVFIVLKDVDHDEVMVQFKEEYPELYDLYYEAKYGEEKSSHILDAGYGESLQEALEAKREIYRKVYSDKNHSFIINNKISNEVLFSSSYSPVVIARLRHEQIIDLLDEKEVVSLSRFENKKSIEESLEIANKISRADIVRDNIGLTGNGIKIGMVEALGVPYINDVYLNGTNITIRSGDTNLRTHATYVARIMIGNGLNGNYQGVAPSANLYCCISGDELDFLGAVEWLINSGVNIINASMGFGHYGYYDYVSQWVDHIAVMHDIHFVKSAGNYDVEYNPDRFITSPGMAYNAITVGGLDPTNGTTWNDIALFTYDEFSSYKEVGTAHPEKPNIVTDDIVFEGGTSYAAPQVAAAMALLCQYAPNLRFKQTAMGAILMASAARKCDSVGTGEKGDSFLSQVQLEHNCQISKCEGAGILDIRWAYGIVAQNHYWGLTIYQNGFDYDKTVYIDCSANSITRVCMFWLKQNSLSECPDGTLSETAFSNLDLYVYDPNGNCVGSSTVTYGNFEIVQFVPSVSGYYTIQIRDMGGNNGKEYVGLAVW